MNNCGGGGVLWRAFLSLVEGYHDVGGGLLVSNVEDAESCEGLS